MSTGTRRATRPGAGGTGRRAGAGVAGTKMLDCAATAGFGAAAHYPSRRRGNRPVDRLSRFRLARANSGRSGKGGGYRLPLKRLELRGRPRWRSISCGVIVGGLALLERSAAALMIQMMRSIRISIYRSEDFNAEAAEEFRKEVRTSIKRYFLLFSLRAPRLRGEISSSSLCPVVGLGDRLAHGGVGLDVPQLVVVHDAEVAVAEGLGHGLGDLGFGEHDLRPVLGLLGDVLLLVGDGQGTPLLGLGLEAALVGFGLVGLRAWRRCSRRRRCRRCRSRGSRTPCWRRAPCAARLWRWSRGSPARRL